MNLLYYVYDKIFNYYLKYGFKIKSILFVYRIETVVLCEITFARRSLQRLQYYLFAPLVKGPSLTLPYPLQSTDIHVLLRHCRVIYIIRLNIQ